MTVRLILTSHGHFDHVGGVAWLQRMSGARVAGSASTLAALARGEPVEDDPQYQSGHVEAMHFPTIATAGAVTDGQTLRLGDVAITAHLTPGHTPGSTTWSWRSCEGARCRTVVYADSLNPVSDDGFRFTGDRSHGSLIASFRQSIAKVDRLPCDVLITVHPSASGLDEKLAARSTGAQPDPFISATACHAYAADAAKRLDARIAAEK